MYTDHKNNITKVQLAALKLEMYKLVSKITILPKEFEHESPFNPSKY